MLSVMVVAVSATVSYVIAVFSALARAARLPMLATLTVLPTVASDSKLRLTLLAMTRFASVARRTCLDQMSGEKTPFAIVWSTNSSAPVATVGYPLALCEGGTPRCPVAYPRFWMPVRIEQGVIFLHGHRLNLFVSHFSDATGGT